MHCFNFLILRWILLREQQISLSWLKYVRIVIYYIFLEDSIIYWIKTCTHIITMSYSKCSLNHPHINHWTASIHTASLNIICFLAYSLLSFVFLGFHYLTPTSNLPLIFQQRSFMNFYIIHWEETVDSFFLLITSLISANHKLQMHRCNAIFLSKNIRQKIADFINEGTEMKMIQLD